MQWINAAAVWANEAALAVASRPTVQFGVTHNGRLGCILKLGPWGLGSAPAQAQGCF